MFAHGTVDPYLVVALLLGSCGWGHGGLLGCCAWGHGGLLGSCGWGHGGLLGIDKAIVIAMFSFTTYKHKETFEITYMHRSENVQTYLKRPCNLINTWIYIYMYMEILFYYFPSDSYIYI